jgi:beta-barrel assembly-enhancing protease
MAKISIKGMVKKALASMLSYIYVLIVITSLVSFGNVLANGLGEDSNYTSTETRTTQPAPLLSFAEERALGRRLAYFFTKEHKVVEDEIGSKRIMAIVERLSTEARIPDVQVRIVEGSNPEAISFPGGFIFVTTRLIATVQDDDELAAAIAHEVAHCAARHTVYLIRAALGLPTDKRGEFPTRDEIVTGRAFSFEFPLALETERMKCEQEADLTAVNWLIRSGYRATALSTLLNRISSNLSTSTPHLNETIQQRVLILNTTQSFSAMN